MPTLTNDDILRLIPHRDTMLLIDGVSDYDLHAKTLTAFRHVAPDDFYFKGHFPGAPIMPGVLIVEALAQAAGIFVGVFQPDKYSNMSILFMSIENVRFRAPVQPTCDLTLHVQLERGRSDIWKFNGTALVGTQVVATAQFTAKTMPRKALGEMLHDASPNRHS
jgi:3-hydroxyacyl-[acyl-carrier-protein] dehydratase